MLERLATTGLLHDGVSGVKRFDQGCGAVFPGTPTPFPGASLDRTLRSGLHRPPSVAPVVET